MSNLQKVFAIYDYVGFVDPNRVYILGKGDRGASGACHIASCLPGTFAGILAIDGDVSPALTPQLSTTRLYVQASADSRASAEGAGAESRAEAAVTASELRKEPSFVFEWKPTENSKLDKDHFAALTGTTRPLYPEKLRWRCVDPALPYPFLWMFFADTAIDPDAHFSADKSCNNSFKVTASAGLALLVTANDTFINIDSNITLENDWRTLTIPRPRRFRDEGFVNNALQESGDLFLAFGFHFSVMNSARSWNEFDFTTPIH